MANPLFDLLNQQTAQPVNNTILNRFGGYNNIMTMANNLRNNLPQNFNPQQIAQGMIANGQTTQQQLEEAMKLADQLTGRSK